MDNKKKIAYGLLLVVAVLAVACVSSVGNAQARYVNTDSWYTSVSVMPEAQVTSNCLTEGGQTVLLGQMELEELQLPFTLDSTQTVTGTIDWEVSQEQADLLQAGVLLNGEAVTKLTAVELAAGGNIADLQLIPTQQAMTTVHEAVTATVTVSWVTDTQTIFADFRVTLPAVTELPEQPGAPNVDTTDPQETTVATEADQTETWDTLPQETQPEETTQATQPEETTEPTEPEETTEPTEPEETTEPTEPEETTEPTEPTDPEETTQPTEPEVEPISPVQILSLTAFCKDHALPVVITVPQGTDRVILMGRAQDGEAVELPPFTRYSIDGGTNWYLLYFGGHIEFTPQEAARASLLLELSSVTEQLTGLDLQAWAYSGETELGSAKHDALLSISTAITADPAPWLISDKRDLVLQLDPAWSECQLTYTVEMLTADEKLEAISYVSVELSEDSLYALRDTEEDSDTLTLMLGEELPQAGSYRITFLWKFEDLCFATEQTSFFINYSSN